MSIYKQTLESTTTKTPDTKFKGIDAKGNVTFTTEFDTALNCKTRMSKNKNLAFNLSR